MQSVTPCHTPHRPAVGGAGAGVAGNEGGRLAHAAGRGDHAFLCVGAGH